MAHVFCFLCKRSIILWWAPHLMLEYVGFEFSLSPKSTRCMILGVSIKKTSRSCKESHAPSSSSVLLRVALNLGVPFFNFQIVFLWRVHFMPKGKSLKNTEYRAMPHLYVCIVFNLVFFLELSYLLSLLLLDVCLSQIPFHIALVFENSEMLWDRKLHTCTYWLKSKYLNKFLKKTIHRFRSCLKYSDRYSQIMTMIIIVINYIFVILSIHYVFLLNIKPSENRYYSLYVMLCLFFNCTCCAWQIKNIYTFARLDAIGLRLFDKLSKGCLSISVNLKILIYISI